MFRLQLALSFCSCSISNTAVELSSLLQALHATVLSTSSVLEPNIDVLKGTGLVRSSQCPPYPPSLVGSSSPTSLESPLSRTISLPAVRISQTDSKQLEAIVRRAMVVTMWGWASIRGNLLMNGRRISVLWLQNLMRGRQVWW